MDGRIKKKLEGNQVNCAGWNWNEGRVFVSLSAGEGSGAVQSSHLTPISYHSFFFSSMETPPGPSATTKSRPPMTEVV